MYVSEFLRRVAPDTIVKWCMVALAALIPVFFVPFAWATAIQSKLLLVSLIVLVATCAFAYARYLDGVLRFPKSILALAALGLPVVYGVSAIITGAPPTSFVSGTGEQDTVLAMVLFYAVLLLGALSNENIRDTLRAFFRAIAAGSLALMSVQVLHVFIPGFTLGVLGIPTANVFGSWHEVGIMAGLGLFLPVALYGSHIAEGLWRWVFIALATLSALMMVVVNMVDVWFVTGGLFIVYATYCKFIAREELMRRAFVVPAIIGVLALCAGFAASAIYNVLPARMQVLQIEVRPSWQGTFSIGMDSIQGAQSALFGSGPNTFTKQWSLYKPLGVNQTEYWNLDFTSGIGFIPTTFVTVGGLGVFAWGLLVLALMWALWRSYYRRAETGPGIEAALLAAAYLMVFHIVYVPTFSLSALTFLFLGIVASHGAYSWPVRFTYDDWRTAARTFLFALAAAIVVLATLLSLRAVVSDLLVNRSAYLYSRDGNTERALSLVQSALFVRPNNDRAHRAAVELGLIRLGELVSSGNIDAQATAALQVSLETTIQHGLAAVSINSGAYQNWLALAGLYRNLAGAGVQGAYENARDAYARVYDANPRNPVPLVQMAQLEVAVGNQAEALALIEKALALKGDLAAALYLRSQIYASQEEVEAAIRDAAAVVQVASQDALGWYNLGAILYGAGRFTDAVPALERAVTLQNDYSNALFLLALSYRELGRDKDALVMAERVVALNPSDTALASLVKEMRGEKGSPEEAGDATDE
jgi:tetratricopeptide (TPR) repeat protein